jgi:two-component system, NarL family, invasion response regulator UvrY
MSDETVRVLIVDDQLPFREAAHVVFELLDRFEIVGEATSGEEALDVVEEMRPDLVVMDINLPGMSGVDATRRVIAAHPDTVVLLVSTYEAIALPHSASVSGALAYVHKEHLDADLIEQLWADRRSTLFRTA